MSAIPPDIAGSAAQAGFASPEASRVRDADRAGQDNAAIRHAKAASDAADSVDTDDGDTAVFSDAEGAGSQGRAFVDAQPEEEEVVQDPDVTTEEGPDAPGHLDLRA